MSNITKYLFWFAGIGVFSLIIMFGFKGTETLELNEVNLIKSQMGILEKEVTFESVMAQTDHIVVGTVIGKDILNESKQVFIVDAKERIEGNDKILVYVNEEFLEIGSDYVFFLAPFNSTIYDKDFYTQHPEFIIKIEDDQNLVRLTNAFEKTYEAPFVNRSYNKLENLLSFIMENYKPTINVEYQSNANEDIVKDS